VDLHLFEPSAVTQRSTISTGLKLVLTGTSVGGSAGFTSRDPSAERHQPTGDTTAATFGC